MVDSTLYIGGYEGHNMIALNTTNGVKRWETFINIFDVLSSLVVANGLVYFGAQNFFFYALDAQTGQKRWQFETAGYVCSNPLVVKNGLISGAYSTASGAKN